MRVVALISGGKDSCFNMMQCIAAGHEIVALANITPHNNSELDSYMYQSVGYEAIDYIAAAMDLPLYRECTWGISKQHGKIYHPSTDDEVEDLYRVLNKVKIDLKVEAVSVGAILSDYQRVRVENVCTRLELIPLAYLWQRDQKDLLNDMIKCEIDAIIIKVATLGLDPAKHLGRTLSYLQPHLHLMSEKYGLNVCGEGGEYETLTLDCPLFKNRLVIDKSEMILHSDDPIAPVGYLKLKKLSLENKLPALDLSSRLNGLPLRDSDGYITDYGIDACDSSEDEDAIDEEDDKNVLQLTTTTCYSNIIEQKLLAIKSLDGWIWIGGIQGHGNDIQEAMRDANLKLTSALARLEHTPEDVCCVTMYISQMDCYNEYNKAYSEIFNHPNPPTRTCVEIPSDLPVVLMATSWKKPVTKDAGDLSVERHTMHVQSRSHWAPANIGPYSQGIQVGDLIYLSAQIGLVPGNLQMVQGGIKSQCQLTLRHISRLLKAMNPKVNLRDVVQGICYVTNSSYIEQARKVWEAKTNNAIVTYVVVRELPKKAMIEWQVWAHCHNNQFEYEETGKRVDGFSISIYRRWNYENDIAAVVCYVSNDTEIELEEQIFNESVAYAIQKLSQGEDNNENSIFSLTIFYSRIKVKNLRLDYLDNLSNEIALVYTLVPIDYVKNQLTYLSISGVRHQ